MEANGEMGSEMKIYIGAENVVSPLGLDIVENFNNAFLGLSGLKSLQNPYPKIKQLFASSFPKAFEGQESKIEKIAEQSFKKSLAGTSSGFENDRLLFVLSTTKGDVDFLKTEDFAKANPTSLLKQLQQKMPFKTEGKIISCACISGLAAIIYAADAIAIGEFDHAMVVGADVLSEFTTRGFDSFYALDSAQCKPFDATRKGLNLGEAAASVVLSRNAATFQEKPFVYTAGATSNDANHISGPSRTGEGLYRAVKRAMHQSEISSAEVDYISAHGTGTVYNDDMEATAFTRLGLANVPTNSLKGYFGHTLGASALVEVAMGLHAMRQNVILKTAGCNTIGVSNKLNVVIENERKEVNVMLKTASGFGGCNAAILVQNG